jgi:hypothetical protein
MHRVYLLLRNNKQQGPYTLDELLQQSLKPFDLVWIEGRSVGWKYPTEIDALKDHVAGTALAAEEKKEQVFIHETIKQTATTTEKKISKPQRVYVSLPGGGKPGPSSDAETFSKKLEKKAEELYQRAQAFEESRRNANTATTAQTDFKINHVPSNGFETETELDTKFSRSLDDIKEEYSAWLFHQKQNKKGSKQKTNLTIIATLFILIAGFTASRFVFKRNDTPLATEQRLEWEGTNQPSEKPVVAVKEPIIKTPAKFSGKKTTRKSISSTKTSSAKKAKTKTPVTQTTPPSPPAKNLAFLPDLVKVTGVYSPNRKGIPDFNITVQNNSDERLRFVAVDVYYYKKDANLAATKTLYFNKIPAHQDITLVAPGNSKAGDVIFKMVLVSNEKGEVYYMK